MYLIVALRGVIHGLLDHAYPRGLQHLSGIKSIHYANNLSQLVQLFKRGTSLSDGC